MYGNAYYIQMNVFCMIILVIIVFVQWQNKQVNSTKISLYKKMVVTAFFYCLSDIFAWLYNGASLPGTGVILEISNIVFIGAPTIIAAVWLEYVLIYCSREDYLKSIAGKLLQLPLVLTALMVLTNPLHHFCFTVDSANVYHRGSGAYIAPLVCYWYIFFSVTRGIAYIRAEKDQEKKDDVRSLFLFLIPIIVAGVLQIVFYGISITPFGYTLGLLMILINYQYEKISTDELTGLNNRREFRQYLGKVLRNENADTVFLCMIDVDYFKTINDQYGHMEGDEALKKVAAVLKRVCSMESQRHFLGRYGGDEFVIAGINQTTDDLERIKRNIELVSEEENREGKKPYALQLSVGCILDSVKNFKHASELVELADRNMYIEKKRRKEERIAFR